MFNFLGSLASITGLVLYYKDKKEASKVRENLLLFLNLSVMQLDKVKNVHTFAQVFMSNRRFPRYIKHYSSDDLVNLGNWEDCFADYEDAYERYYVADVFEPVKVPAQTQGEIERLNKKLDSYNSFRVEIPAFQISHKNMIECLKLTDQLFREYNENAENNRKTSKDKHQHMFKKLDRTLLHADLSLKQLINIQRLLVDKIEF